MPASGLAGIEMVEIGRDGFGGLRGCPWRSAAYRRGQLFPSWNKLGCQIAFGLRHDPVPRVVFAGQTTLCRRLDFQSVGLRAVCLGKPVASKTHRKNFCGSRLILPFGQWLMVALITLGREKPESVWPCAGGRAT
jgi:hypothetical protein